MRTATVGSIAELFVFPVKGLNGHRLASVDVSPESGIPLDRFFALATRNGAYGETKDRPLEAWNFHALTVNPRMAGVTVTFEGSPNVITLRVAGNIALIADVSTDAGVEDVEKFFAGVLDLDHSQRPFLARPAHPGYNYNYTASVRKELTWAFHVVNLASVRDLAKRAQLDWIDPLRFRANVYVDLDEPWIERELLGRDLLLGEVEARIHEPTIRCSATEVNLSTARTDIPIPRLLKRHYDHLEMGVYATFTTSGTLHPGDPVQLIEHVSDKSELAESGQAV